ncbi:MAG: RNA polymerase sigma factor [Planctomycetota bacterium]|jgi:RNA polymerase sigma-70 factor (ECF subfamily)
MSFRSEFEDIAMIHLNAVYRAAVALSGREETAEDMVQITFLKAFENFNSFVKGTNCKAWLMRILRNIWFDELRHQQVTGTQLPLKEEFAGREEATTETVWSDAQDLLENFSDEQVIKALKRLGEEQRLTLFLVDVEGLTQEEVAEIMDIAVGTVKSRTSRAREELKKNLSSYAKDKSNKEDE